MLRRNGCGGKRGEQGDARPSIFDRIGHKLDVNKIKGRFGNKEEKHEIQDASHGPLPFDGRELIVLVVDGPEGRQRIELEEGGRLIVTDNGLIVLSVDDEKESGVLEKLSRMPPRFRQVSVVGTIVAYVAHLEGTESPANSIIEGYPDFWEWEYTRERIVAAIKLVDKEGSDVVEMLGKIAERADFEEAKQAALDRLMESE